MMHRRLNLRRRCNGCTAGCNRFSTPSSLSLSVSPSLSVYCSTPIGTLRRARGQWELLAATLIVVETSRSPRNTYYAQVYKDTEINLGISSVHSTPLAFPLLSINVIIARKPSMTISYPELASRRSYSPAPGGSLRDSS
jgi:hypothetical protein